MIVIESIIFFLPAYLANMAPVFAAKIFGEKYNYPLDGFKTFRGKRIFGDHKTWRGLITGVLVAVITSIIVTEVREPPLHLALIGFLLGFGALAGDAIKSFFKRQLGIASGEKWVPFDQLDFVIGGLLAVSLVYVPPVEVIITLLIITPLLHWLTNFIGYKLNLKKVPW